MRAVQQRGTPAVTTGARVGEGFAATQLRIHPPEGAPVRTLAALLVLLAGTAGAQEAFRTPSGNISCMLFQAELRCDVSASTAPPVAPPADCDLDFGHAFGMAATGPAIRLCAGDTVAGPHPVLPYGLRWQRGPFACDSTPSGLTCRNAQGRGFFLSRGRQDLF